MKKTTKKIVSESEKSDSSENEEKKVEKKIVKVKKENKAPAKVMLDAKQAKKVVAEYMIK